MAGPAGLSGQRRRIGGRRSQSWRRPPVAGAPSGWQTSGSRDPMKLVCPSGPRGDDPRRGSKGARCLEASSANRLPRAAAGDTPVMAGGRRGAIASPPRTCCRSPQTLRKSIAKSVSVRACSARSFVARRFRIGQGGGAARPVLLTPGPNWRHPPPSELMRIGGRGGAWHRAADSSPSGRLAPGCCLVSDATATGRKPGCHAATPYFFDVASPMLTLRAI
jgi:hypothetical protein